MEPGSIRAIRIVLNETYACKHQTPVQSSDVRLVWNVIKRQVADVSEHDAESSPQLPYERI